MNKLTTIAIVLPPTPLFRLYKCYIIDSVLIVKRHGFRELVRRRGWKFLLAVAGYYLVRDTLVYVVLPLWVAHGLL
jgi:hypothetical protein